MKIYRTLFISFFLILSASIQLQAQENIIKSLERDNGKGKVSVYQDIRLTELLTNSEALDKTEESLADLGEGSTVPNEDVEKIKILGYRIQVYAGDNSRKAREEAYQMAAKIKNIFPGAAVYTHFQPPRWLCRVGNFRTLAQAQSAYKKLWEEPGFKEMSIVKSPIIVEK